MIYFELKIDTFGNFEQDFCDLEGVWDNIFVLFVRKKYIYVKSLA